MAHIWIIIRDRIKELQDAATNAGNEKQASLLGDLGVGAEALNSAIEHGSPHSAEIEIVLENLQAWIETANIAATSFGDELDAQVAAVQLYL